MAKKSMSRKPTGAPPKKSIVKPNKERLIYGIEFSRLGTSNIIDVIAEELECDPLCVIVGYAEGACKELAKKHCMRPDDVSRSDAYVWLATELEIDYKRFEHNLAKRPIEPFLALALRTLDFKKPTTTLRRNAQKNRLRAVWNEFIEIDCSRRGCPFHGHSGCGDYYFEPDFEAILERVWDQNSKVKASPESAAKLRLIYSRD